MAIDSMFFPPVDFPLEDGSTYPVDIGYAYNPTMKQYEIVRAFDRANGIGWDGPLNQRIAIYKAGFEGISDEQNEAMDRQCDRFNMFTGFARNNGVSHVSTRCFFFLAPCLPSSAPLAFAHPTLSILLLSPRRCWARSYLAFQPSAPSSTSLASLKTSSSTASTP